MKDPHVSEEDIKTDLLPTREVAAQFGVSVATIDRARLDGRLQAVPHGKGYAFRRTETLEVGDIRKRSSSVSKAEFEGQRDAKILTMLEENASVTEIVKATKIALTIVLDVRRAWLTARAIERRESSFPCRCGAPSDPRAAFCMACFARARPLTDAQLALVSGQSFTPDTCECSSCRARTPLATAVRLCAACRPRVAVRLLEGRVVVSAGGEVLRALSPEETAQLVQPLIDKFVVQQSDLLEKSKVSPALTRDVPQGAALQELLQSLSLKLENP